MRPVSFSVVLVSLLMAGCSTHRTPAAELINQKASFAGDLPFRPLRWRVISSFLDRQASTMSTLYGNDLAVEHARRSAGSRYPAGSALSLVTWQDQPDEHWFGAKIPGSVRVLEFVVVGNAADQQPWYLYRRYEGTPLKESASVEGHSPTERATYILSERAAVMP